MLEKVTNKKVSKKERKTALTFSFSLVPQFP